MLFRARKTREGPCRLHRRAGELDRVALVDDALDQLDNALRITPPNGQVLVQIEKASDK